MVPSVTRLPGRPDVEECEPPAAIAVVHPVLRGELDRRGPLDRPERDLVRALASFDRRREQRLVANVLLAIDQSGRDVDPAQARIEPDRRREPPGAERARDPELGEDRPGDHRSRLSLPLVAEDRLAALRHLLLSRHRDPAATVQSLVELPEVAPVLLARDDVALARQHLPIAGLDPQAGRSPRSRGQERCGSVRSRAGPAGPPSRRPVRMRDCWSPASLPCAGET